MTLKLKFNISFYFLSKGVCRLALIIFILLVPSITYSANRTWSGATGTAWNTASNWVGNNLPGNGDNVLIPGGLTNYPVVTANVNTKIITINSTGTGGRLTINAGTFNVTSIIINSTGMFTVTGGIVSASGVTVAGTCNISAGTVESSNIITVNAGGVVNQSGGLIHLNGNAAANPNDNIQINAGGIFNQSDGTLFFKDLLPGAGTINQTGSRALIKIDRHWQMGAGSTFNSTAGTVQFTGSGNQSNFALGTKQFFNIIINTAVNPGFSIAPGSTISIRGNFTNNNTAFTNTVNATFIFNGAGPQNIFSASAGTLPTFGNLQVNKSGGQLNLTSNCYVSGNTAIINGIYNLATFISNRNIAGGSLVISATGFLWVGGITGGVAGSNFPINFTTVTLSPGSTVCYTGANQLIALMIYSNLSLWGNGGAVIKTLPISPLSITGTFTMSTGTSSLVTCNTQASFSVSGNFIVGINTVFQGNTYSHTLAGNYVNNGTYISTGTTFIRGTISGTGTYNGANATLQLNGLSVQSIPPAMFAGNILSNLHCNNPAGVILTGNLMLTGILKADLGNFNSNGFLTLVSDAIQSALIDGAGTGSISGTVTMQRYLPAGFGYKYFSSPFQNATVNEFADDLNLSAAFPPFYRYQENSVATGWINYAAPSNILQPLLGYAANFGALTSPAIADVSGVINNSPLSVSLFNTNQQFTTGFNLVGNPYPSPVNWDAAAGWNRVNIDNAVYYFDASNSDQYGGVYSSYINGISSNGIATNLIPSMQAFFIHVSDGTYPVAGSLSINNAARTNDLQPFFHRTVQNDERTVIRIAASFANSSSYADDLVIYFDNNSTSFFDKEKDALEIFNTDNQVPSIYAIAPDFSRLSINAIPFNANIKSIIPLGIKASLDGDLNINLKSIDNLPDSIRVYLYDSEKRINYEFKNGSGYQCEVSAGNINSRFSLILTSEDLPYVTDTDEFGVYSSGGKLYVYTDPGSGDNCMITLFGLQGQKFLEKQLTSSGHHIIPVSLNTGIYIVHFTTDHSFFSKKLYLKNE